MNVRDPGDSRDIPSKDQGLWDEIKKTIKPLRKKQARPVAENDKKIEKKEPRAAIAKTFERPAAVQSPAQPVLPPLASLDRRQRQRIARGNTAIEARLDLHGFKQTEAKNRLARFLEEARTREKSLVLVITGKGTVASAEGERGVLKRQVPLWLALPEFRALVIGFEEAAPSHGGAGALYVRIRRKR